MFVQSYSDMTIENICISMAQRSVPNVHFDKTAILIEGLPEIQSERQ